MKLPIYLDNHATTRVDPRVAEAMFPYFVEHYGNPASKQHEFGWTAEAAVETARSQVASLIGADKGEIIFTSGATESINLALKGVAETLGTTKNHLITARTEHKAVLDTCKRLEQYDFQVTYLPVDRDGTLAPDDVEAALNERTALVSLMLANNEIGTIAPVEEIGAICRHRGVIFHTDAAQAVGKILVDVDALQVDLLSMSAHKMFGPKGIGALYIRSQRPWLELMPQIDGGGHEKGLRSGTLNVPAIVGFGKASEIAHKEPEAEGERVARLRDMLVEGIMAELDGVHLNGHPTKRLPNNANLTFDGVNADRLMMDMKDIAVSSGSACSSESPEPSHVLQAIGLSVDAVLSSLRFGLGRFTTAEEIAYAVTRVVQTVKAIREKSSRYYVMNS